MMDELEKKLKEFFKDVKFNVVVGIIKETDAICFFGGSIKRENLYIVGLTLKLKTDLNEFPEKILLSHGEMEVILYKIETISPTYYGWIETIDKEVNLKFKGVEGPKWERIENTEELEKRVAAATEKKNVIYDVVPPFFLYYDGFQRTHCLVYERGKEDYKFYILKLQVRDILKNEIKEIEFIIPECKTYIFIPSKYSPIKISTYTPYTKEQISRFTKDKKSKIIELIKETKKCAPDSEKSLWDELEEGNW